MHYIDRKAKIMDRHGYYVDTIHTYVDTTT